MKPKKLIILDRDGCLNELSAEKKYIEDLKEFILFDDVTYLFKFISDNNLHLAVATNQQGIGLGLVDYLELNKMHAKLKDFGKKYGIPNFEIFICPHKAETCYCRKPSPTLLLQAMSFYNVTKKQTVFIGDSESDEMAADNAGIDFIFMNRNKSTVINKDRTITKFSELRETDIFYDYL
jgi:D-glycero-D-manno-heptose 1,7-bisphosphate phosphatase